MSRIISLCTAPAGAWMTLTNWNGAGFNRLKAFSKVVAELTDSVLCVHIDANVVTPHSFRLLVHAILVHISVRRTHCH
ncbi:hypothetical protein BDZ88DRAFT_431757 [Geranomyces variabilis]|nr:hypothetical protein BDZ88DRAFT_431757 [Geranomyces variabilis]